MRRVRIGQLFAGVVASAHATHQISREHHGPNPQQYHQPHRSDQQIHDERHDPLIPGDIRRHRHGRRERADDGEKANLRVAAELRQYVITGLLLRRAGRGAR